MIKVTKVHLFNSEFEQHNTLNQCSYTKNIIDSITIVGTTSVLFIALSNKTKACVECAGGKIKFVYAVITAIVTSSTVPFGEMEPSTTPIDCSTKALARLPSYFVRVTNCGRYGIKADSQPLLSIIPCSSAVAPKKSQWEKKRIAWTLPLSLLLQAAISSTVTGDLQGERAKILLLEKTTSVPEDRILAPRIFCAK